MQSKITSRRTGRIFSKVFLVFIAFCLFMDFAGAQPYVNGNLSTGATSSDGTAAPTGYTWSEVQPDNINAGFAASITFTGFEIADDFTVPAGETWNLVSMKFYGYQTGFAGTTSPFNTVRVTIHSGTVTGTVVFGDQTTNRLTSSVDAHMYRIFTGAPGTTRKIWEINAATNVTLPAGTYWIEYATDVVDGGAHFLPSSTVVGQPTQPGNNGQQFDLATWNPLIDGVNLQDMPFTVNYTLTCTNAEAPSISSSAVNACSGAAVTLTANGNLNNAANWEFHSGSCDGTVVGTGTTVTVNPTVTTTYFARGVGGCTTPGECGQITITVTPCICLSPDTATICEGSIQTLSVTGGGTPDVQTATSGAVNIVITDNDPAGVTSSIPITLPPGASVTSVLVGMIVNHTWDSDLTINLKAPNGQVLNLVNARGGNGDDFTNTVVNTGITTPTFATGTAPFTGTFAPDATLAVGPTAYVSNATAATLNTPLIQAGTSDWILALRDNANFDEGTLVGWQITVNYNILPTAIWSGGNIFTDAGAATPYTPGTEANTVYVNPTATTTYTATIATGSCAGPNTVTVAVLPRPVLSIDPISGCGPLTITASGAATYSWNPGTGLNTTTGPTVNANPSSTTIYTVTGTGTNGCSTTSDPITVNSAPTASVLSAVASSVYQINESFSADVPPATWSMQNNSEPVGLLTWFKPTDPPPYPSHSGAAIDYAAANFNNTAGTGTISSWLVSPVVNITNGDVVSFWTRTTDGTFPDRLEVRLSTAGSSTNVGTAAADVGDFTTLLVAINPTLSNTGYPTTWTQFTATISGITGTVTGRLAFRYFVTDAGPTGNNSDFIGVDDVQYGTPSTVNCANVVSLMNVVITGGVGPFTVVFTDGITNTTINNYNSGDDIQVSPAGNASYSIVSVTGANGCVGTGNAGSVSINVTPGPSINAQPGDIGICDGGNGTLTVGSDPGGNSVQWQVSTDGGVTYTNITDGGIYSGTTTNVFQITGASTLIDGNLYRAVVSGTCPSAVISDGALVTINTPAVITVQPVAASVCSSPSTTNASATFTVDATGGNVTYQWQVSTDGGSTFTDITDGGVYSGSTTNTLTISGADASYNNYQYRALAITGGCAGVPSGAATLSVSGAPADITITAAPYTSIYPGLVTVLAATPADLASYQWYLNGVEIPGATGPTYQVNVDGIGEYSVQGTNISSCSVLSAKTITIKDSASNTLFIYPNPNDGIFQVRYNDGVNDLLGSTRILSIYDSKGALVYRQNYIVNIPFGRMDVNLGRHARGVYVVDLRNASGQRLRAERVVVR